MNSSDSESDIYPIPTNTPAEDSDNSDNDVQLISSSYSESDEGNENLNADWNCLPAPIVENIYSFLTRTDQCRMSLVCQRWSKEYNSPSLWRTIKFYLPEHNYSSDVFPEVRFAQKFGHLFRNVEIICKRVRTHLVNDILAQLKLFLDSLASSNSQLSSVKFINILKFYRHLEEEDYIMLLRTLMVFLAAQTNLKLLEFHDTFYRREEGAEILKHACETNSSSLRKIVIKGFVTDPVEHEEAEFDVVSLYCSLKQHIMNLTCIQADYSQLLENIIRAQLEDVEFPVQIGTKRKLALLEIFCEGSKRMRFQGIPPAAWKLLHKLCPELKVHMTLISSSHPRNEYGFYIVEYMPLQHLEYRVATPLESRNLDIGNFFQHLRTSRCHEHLENLTVVWMPQVGDLSTHLIPFLQVAQKLRTLQIFLRHPVDGIEDFFQSLLENRPSCLESAHISLTRVRQDDDRANIMRLADEYSPLLQSLGLNVILVADEL